MGHSVIQVNSKFTLLLAFEVRNEVFVIGQSVPKHIERDAHETTAHHFLALHEGRAIGACRWRETEKGVKLERYAVLKQFRGCGVGTDLLEKVLNNVKSILGNGAYLYLHAQIEAKGLYEKQGFVAIDPVFEEAGILHQAMYKYG